MTNPEVKYDSEAVHFPKHYKMLDLDTIELIARTMTVDQFRAHCRGCIMKYRFRAGKKDADKALQDIAKANEYEKLFDDYKVYCYDYSSF